MLGHAKKIPRLETESCLLLLLLSLSSLGYGLFSLTPSEPHLQQGALSTRGEIHSWSTFLHLWVTSWNYSKFFFKKRTERKNWLMQYSISIQTASIISLLLGIRETCIQVLKGSPATFAIYIISNLMSLDHLVVCSQMTASLYCRFPIAATSSWIVFLSDMV